jgi:hypothetical protein
LIAAVKIRTGRKHCRRIRNEALTEMVMQYNVFWYVAV